MEDTQIHRECSRMVVNQRLGWRELWFKGYKLSVYNDEMWMDDDKSCTTMLM
jgi:hypothetical protein